MRSWLMTIPNEVFLDIMEHLKFVEIKKLTSHKDEFDVEEIESILT